MARKYKSKKSATGGYRLFYKGQLIAHAPTKRASRKQKRIHKKWF